MKSLYVKLFFSAECGGQRSLLMHTENREKMKIESASEGFHGVVGGEQSSI